MSAVRNAGSDRVLATWRGRYLFAPAVLGAVVVLEAAIIEAIRQDVIALPTGVLLHGAVVVLAVVALAVRAEDLRPAILTALAVTTMGPVGALAVFVQLVCFAFVPTGFSKDAAWYRRLRGETVDDRAGQLYEAIVSRRAYRPGAVPPSFAAALTHAPVATRFKVLGQIAKQPDAYPQPLLSAALKSREIAVRASAAAVYARILDESSNGGPPAQEGVQ